MLERGNGTSFASLFARGATSTAGGVYWGGITANGVLFIGLTEDFGASVTTIDQRTTNLDPVNNPVVLEFSTRGDQIALSAFEVGASDPNTTLSFTDDRYSSWNGGGVH